MEKIKLNNLNADLSGQDFSGQDVSSVLFRGSNLSGCSFVGANLQGANMLECNIEGADFTDAILNFANFKGATGTATFTNAKVFGCPLWIDFIGGDNTEIISPAKRRKILIDALFYQAYVELSGLNKADGLVIQIFIFDGTGGEINGDYGIMPEGNMVYDVLGLDHYANEFSTVVSAHLKGNTQYDDTTKTFVKGEEDG